MRGCVCVCVGCGGLWGVVCVCEVCYGGKLCAVIGRERGRGHVLKTHAIGLSKEPRHCHHSQLHPQDGGNGDRQE